MIRVLTFLIVVAALALAGAWLVERPGQVVLSWQGWRIETSVMVLAAAIALLVLAIMLIWSLIRAIAAGPANVSHYFSGRRREKGFRALSRGMIAAGAGDSRSARHYAGEARKLMRREPLTLLLEAQAAQLAGDRNSARRAFEAMLESPDTEILGLRGLFIEAQRAGDAHAAQGFATRAAERAPGLNWAAGALLEFQTRQGDWQAALKTLERNASNKLMGKKDARRAKAVLLTAQATGAEDYDPSGALSLAMEAHRLAPELVPAAVVAGRLSASSGNTRQATRVLEKTWKLSPHPDIAEIYAHARPGDSARDRLKRVRALAQKLPHHEEGRIAIARAAIEARDWTAAREALAPLLGRPPQRVCLLMAEIAEGEGDAGRVREWLSRAVRAPRDPAWTADGHVAEDWAPISPVTGRLDAFEWKVPVEAIGAKQEQPQASAGPVEAKIVLESEAPTEPDLPVPPRPLPEPASSAAVEAAEEVEERDAVEPPPAPATRPAPSRPPAPAAVPPERPAPKGARPAGNAETSEPAVILPRLPDDPGPEPDGDESRELDRRLF